MRNEPVKYLCLHCRRGKNIGESSGRIGSIWNERELTSSDLCPCGRPVVAGVQGIYSDALGCRGARRGAGRPLKFSALALGCLIKDKPISFNSDICC